MIPCTRISFSCPLSEQPVTGVYLQSLFFFQIILDYNETPNPLAKCQSQQRDLLHSRRRRVDHCPDRVPFHPPRCRLWSTTASHYMPRRVIIIIIIIVTVSATQSHHKRCFMGASAALLLLLLRHAPHPPLPSSPSPLHYSQPPLHIYWGKRIDDWKWRWRCWNDRLRPLEVQPTIITQQQQQSSSALEPTRRKGSMPQEGVVVGGVHTR